MRPSRSSALLSVALGLSSVCAVAPLAAASPSTVSIGGTLVNSTGGHLGVENYRVLLLSPSGGTSVATIGSTGAFSFSVAPSRVKGASLQVVRPNGTYAGPVELAVDALGTKSSTSVRAAHLDAAGHTVLSGVGVQLGKVRLAAIGVEAFGARVVGPIRAGAPATAKTWYSKSAVRAYSATSPNFGVVPAAVKLGLLRPVAFTAAERTRLTGSAATLNPRVRAHATDPNQVLPGGDVDGDGIPNAIDVDDNGNLSLDQVDPNSQQTVTGNPWSDLIHDQSAGAFNAAFGGVTPTMVANKVGGTGQFGTWFFISQQMLQRAAGGTTEPIDWARVDCVTLTYCGTVLPGGTSYSTNFSVGGELASAFAADHGGSMFIDWSTFQGGAYGCSSGSDGSFTASAAGIASTDHQNGLVRFCRGSGSATETYFHGMIAPQTGADTLTTFTPGDVYVVNFHVHGAATNSTMAMTLPPYGATVAGLRSVNGSAPASDGSVGPDSSNHLTLSFNRPQRLSLPGESGDFQDEGGLHYGVVLGVEGSEYGCAPGRYVALSPLVPGAPGASSDRNLWPLTDTIATDAPVDPSSTLTFDVDLLGCFADLAARLGHPIAINSSTYINLVAAGEFLTGGANRATLTLHLALPTGGVFDPYVVVS